MEEAEERRQFLDYLKSLRDSLQLNGIKIAMLVRGYPTPEKHYGSGWAHSLSRIYNELFSLLVFVPSKEIKREYEYEGIRVKWGYPLEVTRQTLSFNPTILLVLGGTSINLFTAFLIKQNTKVPQVTFLTGADAFYSPFYVPFDSLRKIPKRSLITALLHMLHLRRYLKGFDEKGDYIVHLSNWQRKACEKSTFYKAKNVKIIPFPVDTKIFRFKQRQGKVKKLICVRPHIARQYGVDLVIQASRGKYQTDIYGEGPWLYKHMALARKLKANVTFFPKFFTYQRELAATYWDYDMGLMLSRHESQGVSICEMQATGLPVITSAIQAIPEFATGGTILIKNSEVDRVEEIIDDINERGILEELSWKAHKGIVEKCGIEKVMKEHLLLFHQLLNERR